MFFKPQIHKSNKFHQSRVSNRQFFKIVFFVSLFLSFSVLMFTLSVAEGFPCSPKAFASSISEGKIIELTNQERIKNNLPRLSADPILHQAAQNKAKDMISRHYFDHYTPEGLAPWNFMEQMGYKYLIAGENLAMDFRTSEGVHNAWMASGSHRANILNKNYDDIAIATQQGVIDNHETTLVVQMFAKKDSTIFGQVNYFASKIYGFILGHPSQNF